MRSGSRYWHIQKEKATFFAELHTALQNYEFNKHGDMNQPCSLLFRFISLVFREMLFLTDQV
ncbi:hypothetical protein TSA66_16710 [Noviherbaspirillum autotrophicum]|uniref:Uncharacterized protein n=1 Tax=Noviherbaspirillum autotrophicum TaxID=709839 RepID=A0A0C2BPR0_9BURK|nr:hypothetical protein TSA66_16710 [Noviherbaspirillum autotrophicum]